MENKTRIDKYLWSIRVYKTRSVAAEACKKGQVSLNNITAKPSKEIQAEDVIVCRKQGIYYKYRVIEPISKRQPAANVHIYAEDITPQEELDKKDTTVGNIYFKRDRGTGRPTERDRRMIDNIMNELTE